MAGVGKGGEGGSRRRMGEGEKEEVHCTAVQHKKAHEKCVCVCLQGRTEGGEGEQKEEEGLGEGGGSRRKCKASSLLRMSKQHERRARSSCCRR